MNSSLTSLKNVLILGVAVFVALFVTDVIIHGWLLASTYEATASLWRPQSEMRSMAGVMMLGQFVLSVAFAWIFAHGYRGTGLGEGVRFGLLIALWDMGKSIVMYSVSPWPTSLIAAWIGFATVQAVLLGLLAATVARKLAPSA